MSLVSLVTYSVNVPKARYVQGMTGPDSGCDLSDVGLSTTGQTETTDNFPLAELWVVLLCDVLRNEWHVHTNRCTETCQLPFPG